MNNSNNKLLEVRNLKTIFKTDDGIVKAVNGVSFHLNESETLGIVGESGSGKSVTNLSIMGLIPSPPGKIIDGEILLNGKNLLTISDNERRQIIGKDITMIFQDPMTSLNPYLKISTQLIEGYMFHNKATKKEALERAIDLLSQVGIAEPKKRIHSYPHEFSGGMRQRVMIAMALMTSPKLLIADEPTTALDVTIQAQIIELLKEIQKKNNLAIIMITHNLGVVAGMTDRTIVMYAGSIVEENYTTELFKNPKHPYTVELLKSMPRIDEERKGKFYSIKGSPPNLVDLPDVCAFYPRCSRMKDICKEKKPVLENITPTHRCACFNPY